MFHRPDQKHIQANVMGRNGFAVSRVWFCFLSWTQHWLGQMPHHKAQWLACANSSTLTAPQLSMVGFMTIYDFTGGKTMEYSKETSNFLNFDFSPTIGDSGRVPLALQDHEGDKTLDCTVLLG